MRKELILDKLGVIYKVTNLKNGKVYIGQTVKALIHGFGAK